jgi:transposase
MEGIMQVQQQAFLGIDVSKDKLDLCLIIGEKQRFKTVKNSQDGFDAIVEWCNEFCTDKPHICMEATSDYMEECAEMLHHNCFSISIINPLQSKSFGKCKMIREKTDKTDARMIAEFCKATNPPLWQPQPEEGRKLRDIVRNCDFLKMQHRQLLNKLGHRITDDVRRLLEEQIANLEATIAQLEKMAKELIDISKNMRDQMEKLTEISGIGKETAYQILANMPPVERFENAKQYAAFAGVTPSSFESGSSVRRRAHMSKAGVRSVRKTLYMAALTVKKHNKNFAPFVKKLEDRNKPAKVIVCAVMRKLVHIFFGMLKNGQHFDPNAAFA